MCACRSAGRGSRAARSRSTTHRSRRAIPHDRNNWAPRGDLVYQPQKRRADARQGVRRACTTAGRHHLLSAAWGRRHQHHAVCATVALRRHVSGGAAVGDRAWAPRWRTRRSAGDSLRRPWLQQPARPAAERVRSSGRSPACRSTSATCSADREPADRRLPLDAVGSQPRAAGGIRRLWPRHQRARPAATGRHDRAGQRGHQLRRAALSGADRLAEQDRCRGAGSSTRATRWRRARATPRPSATPKRRSGRQTRSIPRRRRHQRAGRAASVPFVPRRDAAVRVTRRLDVVGELRARRFRPTARPTSTATA